MITRGGAAERWRKILERQRASGLSALAFCRRAGLAPASLYAWRRRLRNEATFAEVTMTADREATADAGEIELRLPGRRSIAVRPGFDRRTLLDVLEVLEARWAGTEAGA